MIPAEAQNVFSSPEKRNFVLGLLLVLATLAVYNPVSHHPFVNYDDDRYVTDNPHVRAGSQWETVKWAFTTFDEANWHPLTWLSHALDSQLFGLNPAGHHYVNLLLHAINGLLLFWVLWRATGATGSSFTVAALFALHPINVESVAWIAERKSLLSMTFFLLALAGYNWYTRKPDLRRYALVIVLFAFGLMAKPMIITFPFVLILWDYWPLHRQEKIDLLALEKLPLIGLSVASAVITIKAQRAGDAIGSMTKYPASVRAGNAIISYARYIGKAVWPIHLAPMYPFHSDVVTAIKVIVCAFLLIGITALVIAARQRRYLLVGWLWFLGTLVPMIGLVQVGRQAMADRYAYLPFVGLFIMVCWGVTGALRDVPLPGEIAFSALVLVSLAVLTHRQLGYWADNVSLWSHTVQVTSNNFIAEDNLGGALLEQGKLDEAMPHFRAAALLEPSDPMSHLNLAADEQRQGHYSEAVDGYAQVIALTRDARLRASAFTNIGYSYRELGDFTRARQSFQAAVSLRPQTLRAWIGLGLTNYKSGDYTGAADDYARALSIQRWDMGYYLLARALESANRPADAQLAMQAARQLSGNFAELQKTGEAVLSK